MEALVLPHLGPDAVLIDMSIMKAFGAKLDWVAERLALQDGNDTIPTTHMRRPIKSKYCSIITQTSNEKVFLYGFLKNTLSQPPMKRSYVFSVRHDLKMIR